MEEIDKLTVEEGASGAIEESDGLEEDEGNPEELAGEQTPKSG
jgi:hypothetical protein